MSHVVLLGDSIFDNASYVPGEPEVVVQLQRALPKGWAASLLAKDGAITEDVAAQLAQLPPDVSHLALSIGGNNALEAAWVLGESASSVHEALLKLDEIQVQFRIQYRRMLAGVLSHELPTVVCTVYDAVPGLGATQRLALGLFNDVILREAFTRGCPVVDLRAVCDRVEHFSAISPIEPSSAGGTLIAAALAIVVEKHDFAERRSKIYG
jgi:hypothetical protein